MEFIDSSIPNQRLNPMFLGTQVCIIAKALRTAMFKRYINSIIIVIIIIIIVRYHVEIFCSSIASLQKCIKYAPIVTHFLAIWHNYVQFVIFK